ncbi:MAG: response regulator transcription factor [Sedimentisphaerales bacterium]|nr:response regulator transcription factor [Sedimentisphaerales bacterium]
MNVIIIGDRDLLFQKATLIFRRILNTNTMMLNMVHSPNRKKKDKTRILIVDDHPVIREGLTQIINRDTDLLVCAEAGTIGEAVKAVKKQKIDLALVDMLLGNTTGIQVIKKIRNLCPGIIAIVFSMSDKSQYIKQAIETGARGYITKDQISENIIDAIRQVLAGKIYLSKRLAEKFPKHELNEFLADDSKRHYK